MLTSFLQPVQAAPDINIHEDVAEEPAKATAYRYWIDDNTNRTEASLNGEDIESNEMLAKHAAWLEAFRASYTFTKENALDILYGEVGNTFVRVLEDAGVYKCTKEGRAAMMRFIENVNQ